MKKLLAIIILFFVASLCFSQNATVTATVQDPTTQVFANGTVTITFVPTPGVPGPFTVSGAPIQLNGSNYGGALTLPMDGTGTFSVTMSRNDFIQPAKSQWQFVVCPNAQAACTTVTLSIAAAAPNISSSINALVPIISLPAGSAVPRAYSNSELILTPNAGQDYWNVSNNTFNFWNGSTWLQALIAGNGTLVPVTLAGDACTNIINAITASPIGSQIYVAAGTGTCSQSSYTFPNNGATPPNQNSYRIVGAGADAGTNTVVTFGKVPVSGTILNFTGTAPVSGCRINALGQGQLEISGINFVETNAASPCGILTTNTILRAHDNYFYGPSLVWITTLATRIQTTGGASTLKYQLDLGVSGNGTLYNYMGFIKNQGATTVTVGGLFAGSTISVPAGGTLFLGAVATGDGVTHIQYNFSTAGSGDSMNVIAYFPRIGTGGGFNTNLIAGANTTFQNGGGGTWAAQGGATPTITQSINVDQESTWDAIVAGGGTGNDDGTLTAGFQGYGTSIENNVFNQVRSAVLGRSFFNAGNITKNTIWSGSGSTTQGAIDLNSFSGAVMVHSNLIEAGFYKYAFWNHTNVVGNMYTSNSCFDTSLIGIPFLQCYRFESGSTGNIVIHPNGDNLTGGLTGVLGLISEVNSGTNITLSSYGNQGLGYTIIGSTTLSSPAASISFASIPGVYKNLRISFQGKSVTAAVFDDLGVQFNSDSGANYDVEFLNAVNITAGAGNANAVARINTCILYGANTTRANTATSCTIEIPNYSGTTFEKQVFSASVGADSTPANMVYEHRGGSWRNTSAITSITLVTGSGANFATGTTAILYGW